MTSESLLRPWDRLSRERVAEAQSPRIARGPHQTHNNPLPQRVAGCCASCERSRSRVHCDRGSWTRLPFGRVAVVQESPAVSPNACSTPPNGVPDDLYATVSEADNANSLTWLKPAPLNNTFALTAEKKLSRQATSPRSPTRRRTPMTTPAAGRSAPTANSTTTMTGSLACRRPTTSSSHSSNLPESHLPANRRQVQLRCRLLRRRANQESFGCTGPGSSPVDVSFSATSRSFRLWSWLALARRAKASSSWSL